MDQQFDQLESLIEQLQAKQLSSQEAVLQLQSFLSKAAKKIVNSQKYTPVRKQKAINQEIEMKSKSPKTDQRKKRESNTSQGHPNQLNKQPLTNSRQSSQSQRRLTTPKKHNNSHQKMDNQVKQKYQKSIIKKRKNSGLDLQKLKNAELKKPNYNFDCLDMIDENQVIQDYLEFQNKRQSAKDLSNNQQSQLQLKSHPSQSQLSSGMMNDQKQQMNEDQFDFSQYQLKKKRTSSKKKALAIGSSNKKPTNPYTRNHAQIILPEQSSRMGGKSTVNSSIMSKKLEQISSLSIKQNKPIGQSTIKKKKKNNGQLSKSRSQQKELMIIVSDVDKKPHLYSSSSRDFSSEMLTPIESIVESRTMQQISIYESKMFFSPFKDNFQIAKHEDVVVLEYDSKDIPLKDQINKEQGICPVTLIQNIEETNQLLDLRIPQGNKQASFHNKVKSTQAPLCNKEADSLLNVQSDCTLVDNQIELNAQNQEQLMIKAANYYGTISSKETITPKLQKSPRQSVKSSSKNLLKLEDSQEQLVSKSQIQKNSTRLSNQNLNESKKKQQMKDQKTSTMASKKIVQQANTPSNRSPRKDKSQQQGMTPKTGGKCKKKKSQNKDLLTPQSSKKKLSKDNEGLSSRLSLLQDQDIRSKAKMACENAQRKVGILQDIENFLCRLEPQTSSITPIQISSSKKDLVSFNKRKGSHAN